MQSNPAIDSDTWQAPLALTGRLEITRRALPLVVASGVCEVLGFYSYTTGARHGIAVAAVLASQVGGLVARLQRVPGTPRYPVRPEEKTAGQGSFAAANPSDATCCAGASRLG